MPNDICENRHGGADTSVEAFESTPESYREETRLRILKAINDHGGRGATADEIEIQLDLPAQTGSARMSELKRDGYIIDSGERRLTRRGKKARVMVLS